ncbi:hypothetical protein [Salipiger sp. IMCC34102]|nr:hypothetical protein [Salipiger sp. IMCC34102]
MQTLLQGTKGVQTLMTLNWDRMLMLGALGGALYLGAHIALI